MRQMSWGQLEGRDTTTHRSRTRVRRAHSTTQRDHETPHVTHSDITIGRTNTAQSHREARVEHPLFLASVPLPRVGVCVCFALCSCVVVSLCALCFVVLFVRCSVLLCCVLCVSSVCVLRVSCVCFVLCVLCCAVLCCAVLLYLSSSNTPVSSPRATTHMPDHVGYARARRIR